MASLILNGVGDRHCIYDFGTLFDHAIAGIVGYIKIVSSRERRNRMTELTNSLMSDPLRTISIILAALGVLIFAFGRKWFVFRWIFGDRRMFSQLFWGLVIFAIGAMLLYFTMS